MIKGLFFTAALLVPGLAYGAGPSATQSDQVVHAGSDPSCFVGPSVSSIPAPAAAAGFNTCAANYDWTTTSNFTHGGYTYNFSDPATWLECGGSVTTNGNAPLWWRGASSQGDWPCNMIAIVNDGGTNAMAFTFDKNNHGSDVGNYMETVQANSGNGITALPTGFAFPEQFYVEFKSRMVTPDSNAPPNTINMSGWWSVSATPNSPYMEVDFIEMYTGGTDSSGANQGLSFYPETYSLTSSNPSGYSHNNYNVFGERVTMDASANTAICFYVNNVQTKCTSFQWKDPAQPQELLRLLIDMGTQNPTNNAALTGPLTSNTQYYRVFTCAAGVPPASAASGFACASSPITSNP